MRAHFKVNLTCVTRTLHVLCAGISRDTLFTSRVDGVGTRLKRIGFMYPGYEEGDDADVADELLVGFEQGVSGL